MLVISTISLSLERGMMFNLLSGGLSVDVAVFPVAGEEPDDTVPLTANRDAFDTAESITAKSGSS